MTFKIEFHSDFFKDLKKFDKSEIERVYKQVLKIQKHPERYVHLSGGSNCYKIRFGKLRLIYLLKERTIYILIVYRRGKVYEEYKKRLFDLRNKLNQD